MEYPIENLDEILRSVCRFLISSMIISVESSRNPVLRSISGHKIVEMHGLAHNTSQTAIYHFSARISEDVLLTCL